MTPLSLITSPRVQMLKMFLKQNIKRPSDSYLGALPVVQKLTLTLTLEGSSQVPQCDHLNRGLRFTSKGILSSYYRAREVAGTMKMRRDFFMR